MCSNSHNISLSGKYPWPQYGARCVRPLHNTPKLILIYVCLVVISYKNLFFQSLNYDTIENELHWQEKEKPNVKVIPVLESTLLSGVLIVILGLVLANQYLRCIIWLPLYKGGSL